MNRSKIPIPCWETCTFQHVDIVRCMLRFVHSPLNKKKSYRVCVCGGNETELHLFFCCNFHDAAHAILSHKVCDSLADNKLAEYFDCISNVKFLRLILCGLSYAPIQISVTVFCTVDEFLKSCGRFWPHACYTMRHLCVIYAFLLYFADISSSWHDKITIIRLTPDAKSSLIESKPLSWVAGLLVPATIEFFPRR